MLFCLFDMSDKKRNQQIVLEIQSIKNKFSKVIKSIKRLLVDAFGNCWKKNSKVFHCDNTAQMKCKTCSISGRQIFNIKMNLFHPKLRKIIHRSWQRLLKILVSFVLEFFWQTITKTPEIRYGNSYQKYQLGVKPNCRNVTESLDFIVGGTNLMQVYYQFDFDVLFLTCNFIKKMRPRKGNFLETLTNFSVCNIIKNKTPTKGFYWNFEKLFSLQLY